MDRPDRYRLDTRMEYKTPIPASATTDVRAKVENKLLTGTDCANKGLCQMSVALDNSGPRRKRATGSVLEITFEVVPGDNGELKIEEFVNTGKGQTDFKIFVT